MLLMPSSKSPRLLLTTISAASAMHILAMHMSAHDGWPGVSIKLICCSSPPTHHSLGVMECNPSRSSFVLSDIHAKRRVVCPAVFAALSIASNVSSSTELVSRRMAPTMVDLPLCECPTTTKLTCCLSCDCLA